MFKDGSIGGAPFLCDDVPAAWVRERSWGVVDGTGDLSPEQAQVVAHDARAGHLLVLARPGSGKTHTLAARVRRLIDDDVDPRSILAMTFSRRAAEVLKARLPPCGIWAGTFHAVCADILERDGEAIGIPWPFRIADELRSRELLARAAATERCPLPRVDKQRDAFLRTLGGLIERRKQRGLPCEPGVHGGELDGDADGTSGRGVLSPAARGKHARFRRSRLRRRFACWNRMSAPRRTCGTVCRTCSSMNSTTSRRSSIVWPSC